MEPPLVDRIDHAGAVISVMVANSSGGKRGGGSFSIKEVQESYFDFHRSYESKEAIEDVADWGSFKDSLVSTYKTPE